MRPSARSLLSSFLCLAALAAFGQSSASQKTPTALERALMSAEQTYIEAARKGDAAFFKRTLTGDFTYVGYDGQLADRQQMIDEHSSAGFNLLPYNMKVVSLGEDSGIVTYDVVLRVPPSEDQGPPPRYQHFSTVWVRQGDAWKMKFQQMTTSHWGDW